jgi:phenylpropionate dioxygenase-like ring-hydroxylating dioxygenase large terminal subunit
MIPEANALDDEKAHLAAEAARDFPTDAEGQYPLPPSTLPAQVYADPAGFEREMQRIFYRSWFPACPSADLPSPRDYVVWDKLRQSIVIARQDDGSLAAWHNACRHRGARVVRESGSCKAGRFACPWHGFQYDLSGLVRFTPLRGSFDAARLQGLRALPVRVREWSGFVWICFSDDVPELDRYLGTLWDELSFYGLERFKVLYRFQLKLTANWKVVVDAFNETWHVPFTHASTLGHMVQWRDARLKIDSPHSWMTIPVKGFTDRVGLQVDHRLSHICHYLAFPNTFFSCFPTHLQTWNIWPTSLCETEFTAWGMVGPAPAGVTEEQWQKQNDRDWKHFCAVSTEDARVLNEWGSVSRSLGAGTYMFNTAEGRLTAFHEEIARRTRTGEQD